MAIRENPGYPTSAGRVAADKRGDTEWGGGLHYPQRFPDGSAIQLTADEKARAVKAAAWDEVRGDPGTGVGVAERYQRLGRPVPVRDVPLDVTETANGYIFDAATGALTENVG